MTPPLRPLSRGECDNAVTDARILAYDYEDGDKSFRLTDLVWRRGHPSDGLDPKSALRLQRAVGSEAPALAAGCVVGYDARLQPSNGRGDVRTCAEE